MNNNIKDIYSLTPAQEGIYVQHFQSGDAKIYHFHSLFEIDKDADLNLIKKSIELLFLRHPVLKTAFAFLKSTNVIKQVILENRTAEVTVLSQDKMFSQSVLDEIVKEDAKEPLDLQKDNLFKVIIVEFTDKCFLLFRSHHIILDGWCFPIIMKDLQRYYKGFSEGKNTDELAEEINKEVSDQTSYAQYVNWLKKQDKSQASEYWQNLLSDYSYSHIFDKENDSINKDIVTFRTYIGKAASDKIEEYAKKNKVSNNTVFESAFGIALQKFSGSNDILFDKVISGRSIPLKNIENTIGLFVNTVPIRFRSNETSTLADLMAETQKQTIDANRYGILSLSEIYKICNINGRLIDALFAFENYYIGEDLIDDMEKGLLSPKTVFFNEKTEFNLSVAVFKEKSEYIIRTSYSKDTYTEEEILSFVNSYISILELYSDGEKKVKDISVTDMKLLEGFNETEHSYDIPENATLYSLFEKTAKENEERICIRTTERALTFGELLTASEKLDAKIRTATKEEKSVIAVIAERSPEMYCAIYGIIRGGNAYLPIDPDYPQERIEYILENSSAAAAVVQGKFADKIRNIPCIDVTELMKKASDENMVIPECNAKPEDTAYVIYTSGSTGNPKGAMVSHKSAVNRILWMHDKYPLVKDDVILQKTPYTFDVSVWEHFWWGMCGGSLAVSKPGEHFLPAKILEEVHKNKVTHIHFVPSVFELFLNYLETHKEEIYKFESVRYVFLSGEALTANLIQRFYRMYDYSKVGIHNLYGPTECAVDVTYYDCAPTDADPVPIGKPIYNTQMYIVDKYNKAVPLGVMGELCIAGMNVGQGYLNNPDLTAEKFIDNPFGEGKLYRTGDNAYWREDGNIVFCGRIDNQIKLNGQRIEIGEIEAVILSLEEVESVAVILKKENGREFLVAFYSGKVVDEATVKEICRNKLPKYMVPSFTVHLDSIPLNSNGKLDRKSLAEMEFIITEEETSEPVNDTERYICRVFEKILGEKNVGRNSDFFDLGGTSYSMISLLSEDRFQNVSAAEFMRNPTPAMLASVLSEAPIRETKYLEALYVPQEAKRMLIILPFAGGSSEAFGNFVGSLKKTRNDIAVYFIRYLHSLEECENAASEIAKFSKDKKIMFYSHCVGSAVALQIISYLESNLISVEHYFAAASIPPVKAEKRNTWNYVPDLILKRILIGAGVNFSCLSEKKIEKILKDFRKDTDFARIAFSALAKRIKAPTSIILSKNDRFTQKYESAEILWKNYSEFVENISFIDSESHYFQSDDSDELIRIIMKDI